jgi:sulfhydrogenase subunit alpha
MPSRSTRSRGRTRSRPARDGVPYLLGPTARVTLAHDQLHPLAREALAATGLGAELRTSVFRSIVARAVELLHAVAEAADIVDGYVPPAAARPRGPRGPAWRPGRPRRRAASSSIATRSTSSGFVRHAQIVPPTSQNQAAIEHDLTTFAPSVLELPHAEATHRLEQLIRSYDPCISCATHFLDLSVTGR